MFLLREEVQKLGAAQDFLGQLESMRLIVKTGSVAEFSNRLLSRNLLRSPISSLRCSTPLQGAFAFAHANRFAGGEHAPRNPCYTYSYACASRLDLRPLATVSKEV
jgi:hypothetical protein